ncbi:hypothetical protein D9M68_408190 [compost metagenome]
MQRHAFMGQAADVDGVEADGARGNRGEGRRQQLLPRGHRAERACIGPLEHQHAGQAHQEQHPGGGQRQLAVQRPAVRAQGLVAQVVQHREADAADQRRHHHWQQHPLVGGIADQAVGMCREAGIVVGGNGMEQPVPGGVAPRRAIDGMQPPRQPGGQQQLRPDRHHQHQPGHADDIAQPDRTGLGLGQQLGAQPQRAVDHQAQQRRCRHHAESAKLEQHHDDGLAKAGPVRAGIDHDQPGHAHRGHRREERGQPRHAAAAVARPGQHQQHAARHDGQQEPHGDGAGRMQGSSHAGIVCLGAPQIHVCSAAPRGLFRGLEIPWRQPGRPRPPIAPAPTAGSRPKSPLPAGRSRRPPPRSAPR